MQTDGNLVLYDNRTSPATSLWAANTELRAFSLEAP
jgi:hypothetical protein